MTQIILRLTLSSNSVGPFNVYTESIDTTPIRTEVTREELVAGLVIELEGSISGILHKVIVENVQEGCEDQVIEKEITVYSEQPDPSPTPTTTPTQTVTPTPTQSLVPTPSLSPGASPSVTPSVTVTPSISTSPSVTPSVTVTPSITPSQTPPPYGKGLLLIEPVSSGYQVNTALGELGIQYPNFFGFNSAFLPTDTNSLDMYMMLFSNDSVSGLEWYEVDIPLSGDRQYLFDEIQVPQGTIDGYAWYTLVIPDQYLGGGRMTEIESSTSSIDLNGGNTISLNNTLYDFGSVYYNGQIFQNDNYRFYSTWPGQALRLNNSTDLYFRGKTIS